MGQLNLPEPLGDPASRALDSLFGLAVGDALGELPGQPELSPER